MADKKTTEQIEAELSSARSDLAQRQTELAEAESKAAQIQVLYDTKSIAWLNYHDLDGKKWLDTSDKELFTAQSAVKQLTAAAKELSERIAKLEGEKIEAQRVEVEKQIEETEGKWLAECLALDDGIGRLLLSRDPIYGRRDTLIALARQIGEDTSRYEKIAAHLRRSTMEQMFPHEGNWMPKGTRHLYEQPFSKFLEDILRAEHWEDVSESISTDAEKQAS